MISPNYDSPPPLEEGGKGDRKAGVEQTKKMQIQCKLAPVRPRPKYNYNKQKKIISFNCPISLNASNLIRPSPFSFPAGYQNN